MYRKETVDRLMLVKSLFHSNIYFQFLQDVTKVTYQILRKIRLSIANNKLLKYDFETQVLSSQRWDSKFQDCRSKLNYSMKKEKCSTESIDERSTQTLFLNAFVILICSRR